MTAEEFQKLCQKREGRARTLSSRYPESESALEFYAEIASFQPAVPVDSPWEFFPDLAALVVRRGPEPLRDEARKLDQASCHEACKKYLSGTDRTSPGSFFARVLLQAGMAQCELPSSGGRLDLCPRCGQPPQAGSLRPEGDGTGYFLHCSLCLYDWRFTQGRCPGCGERSEKELGYYEADEIAHLRVQACSTCHGYLHWVNIGKEPEAVVDVDEIAGLALDVWAREQGYVKIFPNVIGI